MGKTNRKPRRYYAIRLVEKTILVFFFNEDKQLMVHNAGQANMASYAKVISRIRAIAKQKGVIPKFISPTEQGPQREYLLSLHKGFMSTEGDQKTLLIFAPNPVEYKRFHALRYQIEKYLESNKQEDN
jgi:hypothetical protein